MHFSENGHFFWENDLRGGDDDDDDVVFFVFVFVFSMAQSMLCCEWFVRIVHSSGRR